MNERIYLNKAVHLIREKLFWEDTSEWTNHNFILLSKYIQDASGVMISSRTLRRIVNKKGIYTPQTATKDALAVYLGFQDWEHFKITHNEKSPTHEAPVEKHLKKTRYNITPWILIVILVPAIVAATTYLYPTIQLFLNKRLVIFTSDDQLGTAPHEANFYYDVTRLKATNFFIDRNFYDDEDGPLVPLEKYRHLYRNTFDLPDFYSVKIIAGGERVSCVGIHVITRGWDYVLNNKYYPGSSGTIIGDGVMNLPVQDSVVAIDDKYMVDYRNIRNFDVIADQLSFSTRFKTIGVDNNQCVTARIKLVTKHGRVSITLAEPGCDKKNLAVEVGEKLLNGSFDDLSTLFQDLSYWRNLTIESKDKKVVFFLDKTEILSVNYPNPLEELKGITFQFTGDGSVDYVKVSDASGNEIYSEDFE